MISVIVPVYNVGGYLKTTLDSILDSTNQDIELILVDDGSSDSSGFICDQYAEKDHRIRVIHQENAGVSAARNVGMSLATGDYLSFVDADDMIHPEMLSTLLSAIQIGDYDFSMINLKKVGPDEFDKMISASGQIQQVFPCGRKITPGDYLKKLYSVGSISLPYQSCCNKLFKRNFVQDIKFIKTGSEDTEWNNRMALKMQKGIFIDKDLYFYINRETSASHEGVSPRFIDIMNSYKICLDSIPTDQRVFRSWCLEKLYKTILSTNYRARGTSFSQDASCNGKEIYQATIREFMQSAIYWQKKYTLLLFYHVPWLYHLFMMSSEWMARVKK